MLAQISSSTSIKTTNHNDTENIENAHFLFQNLPTKFSTVFGPDEEKEKFENIDSEFVEIKL